MTASLQPFHTMSLYIPDFSGCHFSDDSKATIIVCGSRLKR